jgi:hypothetical protein
MSDISPTRSAVIEMKDERRAMHEGHFFLDEKCLLLGGEMLQAWGHKPGVTTSLGSGLVFIA